MATLCRSLGCVCFPRHLVRCRNPDCDPKKVEVLLPCPEKQPRVQSSPATSPVPACECHKSATRLFCATPCTDMRQTPRTTAGTGRWETSLTGLNWFGLRPQSQTPPSKSVPQVPWSCRSCLSCSHRKALLSKRLRPQHRVQVGGGLKWLKEVLPLGEELKMV